MYNVNIVISFGTKKVDFCCVFLKLTEPMIPYNIHSYSGMAKMDIIFIYSKKKKKHTKLNTGRSVSCKKNFYYFHFTGRDNFNQVLRMKGETSHLMVYMCAKIETEILVFIRRNKNIIRVVNYIHLQDFMHYDYVYKSIGQEIILRSS